MSTLMERVGFPWRKHEEPQSNDLRVVGTNDATTETPLVRIRIYPGMISYDEGLPLITADGAPVTSTGANQWGQLYAVGRR